MREIFNLKYQHTHICIHTHNHMCLLVPFANYFSSSIWKAGSNKGSRLFSHERQWFAGIDRLAISHSMLPHVFFHSLTQIHTYIHTLLYCFVAAEVNVANNRRKLFLSLWRFVLILRFAYKYFNFFLTIKHITVKKSKQNYLKVEANGVEKALLCYVLPPKLLLLCHHSCV